MVKRLNDWYSESKIPLVVKYGNSGYRLRAESAYVLRIPINVTVRTKIDDFLKLLKNSGLVEKFPLTMVVEKLQISHRNATRLISEAVACGRLERQRLQRSTLYSIIS